MSAIALNIGNKDITDPSIEDDLALLAELSERLRCAVVKSRRRGDRLSRDRTGSPAVSFSTSIPVELAIAGLRLVLAGGVTDHYRALDKTKPRTQRRYRQTPALPSYPQSTSPNRATRMVPEKTMIDLTPREQQVLAALKLGLPNKLIAVKLNLSENTVKMHIQHIMRKCSAHNRTEAVLRWSERLTGHNGHARSQVPPSS